MWKRCYLPLPAPFLHLVSDIQAGEKKGCFPWEWSLPLKAGRAQENPLRRHSWRHRSGPHITLQIQTLCSRVTWESQNHHTESIVHFLCAWDAPGNFFSICRYFCPWGKNSFLNHLCWCHCSHLTAEGGEVVAMASCSPGARWLQLWQAVGYYWLLYGLKLLSISPKRPSCSHRPHWSLETNEPLLGTSQGLTHRA